MDLELISKNFSFFDTAARLAAAREQTREQVVPDGCPDVLRVIAAYGVAYPTERSLGGGRAEVSGSIRAVVLYLPESGEGVESVALDIPFSDAFDVASDSGDVLFCAAEVESIDARTINPRKLLVRASVRISANVLHRREVELACDVSAPASLGVCKKCETARATVAVCAGTKNFTLTDVIEPSGVAIREVIRPKLTLSAGETNIIGRRAVFKAKAVVEALCRTKAGALYLHRAELPFSQIIEPEGLEEGVSLAIELSPLDLSLSPRAEDGALELSFTAEAHIIGYAERELDVLGDLYSTAMRAEVAAAALGFEALCESTRRTTTVRATIDAPAPARDIEDTEVVFFPATIKRADGGAAVESSAELRVRYTAEDGTQYRASTRLPIELPLTADADALDVSLRAENIAATALGGIEVRFDAVADIRTLKGEKLEHISAAKLAEFDKNAPAKPSLVLRYPQEGEGLWALAKKYATTEDDIREANGLSESEKPDPAKLMLIPRRR